MSSGAVAVTSARNLVLNTPFPRLLLVVAAMRTSVKRFLPTVPVFLMAYLLTGQRLQWGQLAAIPAFILIVIFATGMCALLATLQVFFRDTTGLLPFVSRMWLYISPVLYYAEDVPAKLRVIEPLNPLYSLLGAWGDTVVRGTMPGWETWALALFWAVAACLLGCWAFMSKESDFAVRI
jgi:ABC-type polysaccharide/polyol phosphate export permease